MPRVPKLPSTSSDKDDITPPFRESSPQNYKLVPRSCRGCHQRKVRCDRRQPCNNCSRHGITCVYTTRNTDAPNRSVTLQNISNRLERLETLLLRLTDTSQVNTRTLVGHDGIGNGDEREGESHSQFQAQVGVSVDAIGNANQDSSSQRPYKSTWELLFNDGRAVPDTGNSNIEDPQQDEARIEEARPPSPEATLSHAQKCTRTHHRLPEESDTGVPVGMVADVLELYPDTQLALRLWKVYVKSVDPVLKILHIPTVQTTVIATILDPRSAQPSTVALTFAIYYAAVTVLCYDDDEDSVDLPREKPTLLKRCKTALDRLLIPNDLANRPQLESLQALAIYATCLRAHEIGRSVWVLNGLAIRLAQSIGLNRDGASLRLSPFETEIRLRLWWHLCILESRAPEDQGIQPTVDIGNWGLRLPLNVNDDQIYPGMTSLPTESTCWTEMSFFLIQTQACRLIHPILETPKSPSDGLQDIEEKRNNLRGPGYYTATKYGVTPGSETLTDLPRIASQHIITAGKKMMFVLQLREEIILRKQKEEQDDTTPDVLKLSFKLACEGLESSYILLKEGLSSRFRWFFSMYTQWYALAYVLRCLCNSPCGFDTDRAWFLVGELLPRGLSIHDDSAGVQDVYGNASIWGYLNRLRHQALSLRQQAQTTSVTAGHVGNQPFGTGRPTSQVVPDADMPRAADTVAMASGASAISDLGQEYVTNPSHNVFSSLDLSMSDIALLPDWNAVINGCLNDDNYEINPS